MTDLLLIVPHPDDEVFGAGALLARTAAEGGLAAILTLTRGAAGRTLGLATREELPAVREAELRAAARTLGVEDVTILDYQDFVPDEERGLPLHAGLAAAPQEELLTTILEVIERTRPRAVLTFPPNGANGHPDHVVTNALVRRALEQSEHEVTALYYYAAESPFEGPQQSGFLAEEEMRRLFLPPTHYLEAGEQLAVKLSAIACHRTQALSVLGFMRRMPGRLIVESFHRAFPPVAAGAAPERVSRL